MDLFRCDFSALLAMDVREVSQGRAYLAFKAEMAEKARDRNGGDPPRD